MVYVDSSKMKDTVGLKQPHRNVMTGGTPQNKSLNLLTEESVTKSVGRLFHSLTTPTKKAESILKAWVGALKHFCKGTVGYTLKRHGKTLKMVLKLSPL